jgi:hypothetical protein
MNAASLIRLLLVLGLAGAAAEPASRWEEFGGATQPLAAIEPTPTGESHVGLVPSGDTVPLCFPVPREPVLGYWLGLANLVAYSGKGSAYQLLLRRDSPQGAVVYTGPVIGNGDAWNASNGTPVDLTECLTPADRERGAIDIYATGIVADDGWTLYRHQPQRPVLAYAVIETADTRRQVAAGKVLQARGVAILPVPQELEFSEGTLLLPAGTRILVPPNAPDRVGSAAQELRELVLERTGVEWVVAPTAAGTPGIVLAVAAAGSPEAAALPVPGESYVLTVTGAGVTILGRDPAGCFYGAMTLGQMAQAAAAGGVAVPHGRIRDWPAFPQRLIQYDVARGQTIDVDYVKRMIRELARCKVNGLVLYMEDDFQFRQYPFLGRPGTFTHDKARELAPFARRHGVQLIPQFEALGHGAAVLQHPEMAALREGGDPWVFCTSAPETWAFFDTVFGELVEAFPDTAFIHTGGDEFEPAFGTCERCRATIAQRGPGGLYAEHMNRLNALVRKHGRTMLFWPSHTGPTPALSDMTLQYQGQLERDCIPTEWIYHGPATYPTLEAYQQAGFKDVFCSPAVESYSRVWPDHVTTFRAIRGFYRAGAERGCGGAYCTTWEFMHGALWENSWYGLLFAAECSWNPNSTSRSQFARRFADIWWGISPADDAVAATVDAALFDPLPGRGPAALWHSGVALRDLLWAAPQRVLRESALKRPEVAANLAGLRAALGDARERLESLAPSVQRNPLTLRAARLGFALSAYAGDKLGAMQEASACYHAALSAAPADGTARTARLGEAQAHLLGLQRQAETVATEVRFFVEHCGAYAGDAERLQAQAAEFARLAAALAAGQTGSLPPAGDLGFLRGSYTAVGEWLPAQMREDKAVLRLDLTPFVKVPGEVAIEWEYTRGAHALAIMTTQLLVGGKVVAEDRHDGLTGAAHSQNSYRLVLPELPPGAHIEVQAEVASRGGTDSYGTAWLVTATPAPAAMAPR